MESKRKPGTEPLVSIVIPVYNGGEFLSDAIDSALAQTYGNVEIIVVNDGSDDGGRTEAVIRSYGDQIRSIHQGNGGVAAALNAGIAAMKGSYFSWLSHDDVYLPRKIEKQLAIALSCEEPTIVYGNFQLIDDRSNVLTSIDVCEATSRAEEDPFWLVLEGKLCGCAMLVPTECLGRAGPFDTRLPMTQDYDLWFKLAKDHKFTPCTEYLVQMRIHAGQGSKDRRHFDEASLLWIRFCSPLPERLVAGGHARQHQVVNRLSKGGPAQVYKGFALFLDRLRFQLRSHVEVGVVIDAASEEVAGRLIWKLRNEGFREPVELRSALQEAIPVERLLRRRRGGRISIDLDVVQSTACREIATAVRRLADDAIVVLPGAAVGDDTLLVDDMDRIIDREVDAVGRFSDNGDLSVAARCSSLREALRRTTSRDNAIILQELAMVGPVDVAEAPADLARQASEPVAAAIAKSSADASAIEAAGPSFVVREQQAIAYLGRYEMTRLVRRILMDTRLGTRFLNLAERTIRPTPRRRDTRFLETLIGRIYGLNGRFDKEWYLNEYPDVASGGRLPLLHYLNRGWREGRKPYETYDVDSAPMHERLNPLSLQVFYGYTASGPRRFGSFGLTHHLRRLVTRPDFEWLIRHLEIRCRRILPSTDFLGRAVERMFGVRGLIDREWYLDQNADVRSAGIDPSIHYLLHGWREGRDPNAAFQTAVHVANLHELGNLNPLSKSVILGRVYQQVIRSLDVPPPQPSQPLLPLAAQPDEQAELLLLNTSGKDGRAWIDLLHDVIRRRVRIVVASLKDAHHLEVCRADGSVLGYYDLAHNFPEAVSLIRRMRIQRVDVLDCGLGDHARDFLDALQIPYDLTVLSVKAGAFDARTMQKLARGAERVQVPVRSVAEALASKGLSRPITVVGVPGAAEAVDFPIHGPSGCEKLRIVAFPAAEDAVPSLLANARHLPASDVEAFAVVPRGTTLPSSHLTAVEAGHAIDATGVIDPHLVWIHGARDVRAAPLLREVLLLGRPLLSTDCGSFSEFLAERPFTWSVDTLDRSTLETLARDLSADYRGGLVGTRRGPANRSRFDRIRYLSWL